MTITRASDLPARVGGEDEFVVIFWEGLEKGTPSNRPAPGPADRRTGRGVRRGADLGASIRGCLPSKRLPDRPEATMLEEADRALREAKAAGKGQVVWRDGHTGETQTGLSAASPS